MCVGKQATGKPKVLISCRQCGKAFDATPTQARKGRKFCSNACKHAFNRPPARECKECGKTFWRKPKGEGGKNDKALFCSKPCYHAARNAGRVQWDTTSQRKSQWHRGGMWKNAPSASFMRHLHNLWGHINRFRFLSADMAAKVEATAKCETCGAFCGEGANRFCSRVCLKQWRGMRRCRCGAEVNDCTAYSSAVCDACKRKSLQQQRRNTKRESGSYRKKCRKFGGHYNPQCKRTAILKRDMYKCHVCGRKCITGDSWNHPRAATVDHHPVPLSKGGDHDWHNVRCACRQCNSEKSDKWDHQRLLRLPS